MLRKKSAIEKIKKIPGVTSFYYLEARIALWHWKTSTPHLTWKKGFLKLTFNHQIVSKIIKIQTFLSICNGCIWKFRDIVNLYAINCNGFQFCTKKFSKLKMKLHTRRSALNLVNYKWYFGSNWRCYSSTSISARSPVSRRLRRPLLSLSRTSSSSHSKTNFF